jgi:hypothetical protein
MWRCTGCRTENQETVFFCSWCACHRQADVPAQEVPEDLPRLCQPPRVGEEFCLWRPPINPETGLIVFRTSQQGILGLLLYTMMPLVIGLAFLVFSRPEVRSTAVPLGIFFLLMAGLPGGYLLRVYWKGKIAVILDRSGILINTSPLSSGRILWADISKGELVVRGRSVYIGLDVRDRTKYRCSRFNLLFNRYPFVITDWAVGDALSGLWFYVRRIIDDPELASDLGVLQLRSGPTAGGP